jgi:hypothetical protein
MVKVNQTSEQEVVSDSETKLSLLTQNPNKLSNLILGTAGVYVAAAM